MARRWGIAGAGIAAALLAVGCAGGIPRRGLESWRGVNVPEGVRHSRRTLDSFREIDLHDELAARPAEAFAALAERFRIEPRRDWCYALAEAALVESRRGGRHAADWRLRAVQYAYAYLMSPDLVEPPNPLDPRQRLACDLYNEALAGLIEQARAAGTFDPQGNFAVALATGTFTLPVVQRGFAWRRDELDELVPAQAPRPEELGRDIRQYGLGVPMVGIRRKPAPCEARDQFLIDRHPFAVTVALRPDLSGVIAPGAARRPAELAALDAVADDVHRGLGTRRAAAPACAAPAVELLDPFSVPTLEAHGHAAAVEAEFSAPLVHALRSVPRLRLRAEGFLDPARAANRTGLVMLQPYQPGKIPVVFVHGLISDPLTWKDMLNELAADPALRGDFQWWAFSYPTGQNLLANAAKLRRELAAARQAVDPEGRDPALARMVLVGHSMGGLLAKLQAADSGDALWRTVATEPFERVAFRSEDERRRCREQYFFEPDPAVARVVTLGTPHRGSRYGNGTLGRVASSLVRMPRAALEMSARLAAANPTAFRPGALERLPTSVDQLAVDNPILLASFDAAARSPAPIHTVAGVAFDMGADGPGDGVVSAASARLPNAESAAQVPAGHAEVHRHPRSILEVKRILRTHLRQASEPQLGGVVPAAGAGAPDAVIPAN